MHKFAPPQTLRRLYLFGLALLFAALVTGLFGGISWLVTSDRETVEIFLELGAILGILGLIVLCWRIFLGFRGNPV